MPRPPKTAALSGFWIYIHRDFVANPYESETVTLQKVAKTILRKIGGKHGYTFTAMWMAEGMDSMDNLDEAVALATNMSYREGGYAEVRISGMLVAGKRDGDPPWSDLIVFAIGSDPSRLERVESHNLEVEAALRDS